MTPGRRVFDGVVQQISERLREQMAVCAQLRPRGAAELERELLVLGQRPVKIGEVAPERVEIDRLEPGALAAGIGSGRCGARRRAHCTAVS